MQAFSLLFSFGHVLAFGLWAFCLIAVGVAMSGPLTIIRRRTVCARTGLSGTTIWRLTKLGRFPAAIQISPGAVGWFEHQVEAWIKSRAHVKDEGRSPNPRAQRRHVAADRETEKTA